jgi:VanZ family protein
MGFIFYLSSQPSRGPSPLPDYVVHFVEYFILGYLVSYSLFLSGFLLEKSALFASFWALIYGISDEFHQMFVPTRTPSLKDVFFDALGGIFAAFLWLLFKRKALKKG